LGERADFISRRVRAQQQPARTTCVGVKTSSTLATTLGDMQLGWLCFRMLASFYFHLLDLYSSLFFSEPTEQGRHQSVPLFFWSCEDRQRTLKTSALFFGNDEVRRCAAGRMKSERRFYTRSSIYADEKQELTWDAASCSFRYSRSRRTWLWATSIIHDMGAMRFPIRVRRGQRANMRSFLQL